MKRIRTKKIRGARAPGPPLWVPRTTHSESTITGTLFGEAPKTARGARALPATTESSAQTQAGRALEAALENLFRSASEAIKQGTNIIVLSDRGVNENNAPIPALLAVSGLHHHFKSVTAMSPLQFQKRLRLQEARRLLLVEGLDAAHTAYRVGYNDASQFNREYKRLFGLPPLRDVERLQITAGQSAA